MDELHDADILREILAKKDYLITSKKEKIAELENIVESQQEHIAMLQNDLYNEQLRNSNLAELAIAIDKQKGSKPEET